MRKTRLYLRTGLCFSLRAKEMMSGARWRVYMASVTRWILSQRDWPFPFPSATRSSPKHIPAIVLGMKRRAQSNPMAFFTLFSWQLNHSRLAYGYTSSIGLYLEMLSLPTVTHCSLLFRVTERWDNIAHSNIQTSSFHFALNERSEGSHISD